MTPLDPYATYIYLGIIGVIVVGGLKVIAPVMKAKVNQKTKSIISTNSPKGLVAKARDLIQTAPEKCKQIELEIQKLTEEAQRDGKEPPKMEHLKFEYAICSLAANPIAQFGGETAIDLAQQFASRFGFKLR